jgi:hypothetical protein
MSKKSEWKGTEPVARSAEQHRLHEEYEAMSPEEKKAAARKQFVGFLEMAQGDGPIMYMNGKPQPHVPMSKEEADLHLSLFDGEIEPTNEIRLELLGHELVRCPKSKRLLARLWKLTEEMKQETL